MRNVFDQYKQPENRLTHALMTTLNEDRSLIRPFLRKLGIVDCPPLKHIALVEQQMPGEYESGDEDEKRGLPDAVFFDERGDWCCLIEAKVQSSVERDQLDRHLRTARRRGFENPQLVLLAVSKPKRRLPEGVTFCAWSDLYVWFGRLREKSFWAQQLVHYMEVFEAHASSRRYGIEGTITMFDGIRFDEKNPYTYFEARRLIRLLRGELVKEKRLRKIGADLKAPGRKAITGKNEAAVWDYIPLVEAADASAHTSYPHLTIGIRSEGVVAATITVPHSTKGGLRSKLRDAGKDEFVSLLRDIHSKLEPVYSKSSGARAVVYAVQRHYPGGQKSVPVVDARLQADLRTLGDSSKGEVKKQPQWLAAMHDVLAQKKSNIQFGLTVEFQTSCPLVRTAKLADLIADAWIAGRPLLDFVLGRDK